LHLAELVEKTGSVSYVVIFLIIFMETGLVVTPFLPGDSLLFGLGAIAATGVFNIWVLYLILILAAVTGDSVNYWIGKRIGPKAYESKSRFLNKNNLDKAHRFYEKHGGKAIIISRFVPVVRSFAPFIAGIAGMDYREFLSFNLIGGVAWISLFLWAGYLFGNIPFVKQNFDLVIILIVIVSLIPVLIEYLKSRSENKSALPPKE
jgi:membrane-associated protein